MSTYLAIDIGASNGRHVIGEIQASGQLVIREIYRFPNQTINEGERLIWDVDALFVHVLEGLKEAKRQGYEPETIGIDTWAVDYALLDAAGERLDAVVAYRDERTQGMPAKVEAQLAYRSIYERTGCQQQSFNTMYQLLAVKETHPEQLEQASHLLMVPDYLNYLLTGQRMQEYTNATSTGLVNLESQTWDLELIRQLGLPETLFGPLSLPGTVVGELTAEVVEQIGYTSTVVHVASHDTASAFLAVPSRGANSVYLSSGTWSLLGVELDEPILTEAAFEENFTNEGGFDQGIRFLKNIMGLWMIQSLRKESNVSYSFEELATLAEASDYAGLVDVNAERFFAPASMREAVQAECVAGGYPEPQTFADVLRCVYRSLALAYKETMDQLEAITGQTYTDLHIVGGGSQDTLLNRLTAQISGRSVWAGPVEATTIGNLGVQLMAAGAVADARELRTLIRASFPIEHYQA